MGTPVEARWRGCTSTDSTDAHTNGGCARLATAEKNQGNMPTSTSKGSASLDTGSDPCQSLRVREAFPEAEGVELAGETENPLQARRTYGHGIPGSASHSSQFAPCPRHTKSGTSNPFQCVTDSGSRRSGFCYGPPPWQSRPAAAVRPFSSWLSPEQERADFSSWPSTLESDRNMLTEART